MSFERAYITTSESGERLECMFNPEEITIAKSSKWKRTPNRRSRGSSEPEFVGTNPRTLKMELLFDGTGKTSGGDVSGPVDTLLGWTSPTEESISNDRPQPPLVILHWGSKSYFEVYVKQVTAKFVLFNEQGTPIRAKVNVTLEETPETAQSQNPTSGGRPGRRTHLVTTGETLPSIAYAEYRQADRWRAIAIENNIDDPFRLRPGTSLLIPPSAEAERLA